MALDTYTFHGTLLWEHPEDDSLDVEFEVTAIYGVTAYIPARGPSYASGGEPPEPRTIEDVDITMVDGKPWANFVAALPFGLPPCLAHIALAEKLTDENYDQMVDAAEDQDESARADWEDLRRDEREEDDRYWSERQNGDDD